MLVLTFKPGQSLTLRGNDGTESVIHFRYCRRTGQMSVALDLPDDTQAIRNLARKKTQAAEAVPV